MPIDRTRPFNPPNREVWNALKDSFGIDLFRGGVVKFHGIEITKAMVEAFASLVAPTTTNATVQPVAETVVVECSNGTIEDDEIPFDYPKTTKKKGQ